MIKLSICRYIFVGTYNFIILCVVVVVFLKIVLKVTSDVVDYH